MKKTFLGCSTATLILLSSMAGASADQKLIDAARHGETMTVQALLQKKTDVNLAEADGTTALHWAAHRGDNDLLAMLLAAGAKPDTANDYGVTPLWLACTNQNADMVQTLLKAGANANAALWNGESVLMKCAQTGTTDGVEALLQHGADVSATESKRGQTALMWAAAGGHSRISSILVKHGADIRATSANGFTPLLFAARSGDIESARILIDAGADPNEGTASQGNALVIASAGGHEELAIFLLKAGAKPNSADQDGITALHHAARNGLTALDGVRYDNAYRLRPPNMPKLAKALLESGADPNARIVNAQRRGPDGSPFEMVGATPLMLAAISADAELMHVLEEFEADPGLMIEGNISPLMAAARSVCTGSCAFAGNNEASEEEVQKSLQAVKAAVEMGADVNARNSDGQTAIHMAAFTGATDVVKYLAEQGAEINIKDNYGQTPWSMASGISPVLRYAGLYGKHETTAALLLKLGAETTTQAEMDPNAPPPPGQ